MHTRRILQYIVPYKYATLEENIEIQVIDLIG